MVDTSPSPTVPRTVTVLIAPMLFGPLFNWALYGVLLVQTYVYSYNFPDDKLYLKLLVYFVFLLETAQTILTGFDIYHWFVTGFNNLENLDLRFTPIDIPIMFGLIALIVQMFFCSRIWILNKRLWWLCIVIALLSVIQAAAAIKEGIKDQEGIDITSLKPSVVIYLWFSSDVLSDVLISVAMTYLLIQKLDNENQFSSYVFPRVVRLIIETNILTTTVAIVTFVLLLRFPNETYFMPSVTVFGKLYSNTLLVILNNRIYFRDHPFPGVSRDSVYHASGRNLPSEHRLPVVKPPFGVHARDLRTNDTFRLDTLSSTIDLQATSSSRT